MTVKVQVKHDEQYGDSNEVKGFKAISGSAPPTPSQNAEAPAQGGGESSAPKPPWAQ